MINFQPFGDRILIRVVVPEERTSGGLLVAPVSKESSNRGEVVAVGEGTTLADGTVKPLSVSVGDIVIFPLGSGLDYSIKKENYKIIGIKEVLGKIVKGAKDE